jgi:hypothetical protein
VYRVRSIVRLNVRLIGAIARRDTLIAQPHPLPD